MSPQARLLLHAALRNELSVADLTERAHHDASFRMHVLAFANSPLYERQSSLSSVADACKRLGLEGLRSVALSIMMADLVPAAEGADALLSCCLRRAVAARELARFSGSVELHEAFCTGMLLDMGLVHRACDEFEACTQVARTPGRHRATVERALGLAPHANVGAQLARDLGLTPHVTAAIAEHHATQKPDAPLSAVCWAAEQVAAVGEGSDRTRNMRAASRACSTIGIAERPLQELIERLPREVDELSMVLESAPVSSRRDEPQRSEIESLLEQYEDLMRVVERLVEQRDRLDLESLRPSSG